MARPKKQTVDYFPHSVKCGRTIYILENRFGNDGYSFWFKLLEILGESEGHFYDCSNVSNWEYLLAKTRATDTMAQDIIKVLINLGKIDAGLWNGHRVIWVENFVKNISDVYRTRNTPLPSKPCFETEKQDGQEVFSEKTQEEERFSLPETPKGEERKPKENRGKNTVYPYQDIADLWNSICTSLPKVQKLNDNRRQKIKCRCDEWGKTPDVWMRTAEDIFRRMQASDFLKGTNGNGWVATFDWLFSNSGNSIKVMEGNYDNKRGAGAQQEETKANLGVGEYIDKETGRRTYGSGKATIPQDAPPRPSDKHAWDSATSKWVLL